MLWLRTGSETVEGIQIRGAKEFLLRTREALVLLRSTSRFAEIQPHMALISQGKRSGMKAWAENPTFLVGDRTWKHSALWYAGAIAHDAFHSKLYHDAKRSRGGREPDADAWTGSKAEKICLAFQRKVLLELSADDAIIAYIDECEKNPAYQGRNKGWKSWLDYLKRWW
jgi:hypothetical protein